MLQTTIRQDKRCMQDCQKVSNNALNTNKAMAKTGEGYKARHNNYNIGNGNYAPQYTRIIPRSNVANQHVLILVFEAANFDRLKKYAALCVFLLKPGKVAPRSKIKEKGGGGIG